MNVEKMVDTLIWGGIDLAEKLPNQPLRFIGVIVAFLVMLISAPIWLPLVIFVGFSDIWNDVKDRK